MKGLFITFEGVEGCGKTTQLARLRAYLEERAFPLTVTREPGGTPIAEAIRSLLLDPANTAMSAMAELLLYEAARAQHVAEVIAPALDKGQVVLCDRFADSTTAYQGAARGLPDTEVERLHALATAGVWPRLTILLDLDPEAGLRRARQRGRADRLEQESLAFHQRVRQGFMRLAEQDPERIRVLDGTGSVDEIAAAVRALVDPLLD